MPEKVPTRIPSDMVDDQVLSYPEMEAVSGVSKDSIRRAAERGQLKLTRLGPRRVGARKSEFRRWLDQSTA
jgi:predicted DNA-binding transcriptional regulator AlpA